MDGIYEMNIKTPMGNMASKIKLITNGNNLSGYIEVMGKRNEFLGGKVNGNNFTISGSAHASIATIKYDIKGTVQGNILYIDANTNMGSFKLQGKKIG